MIKTGLFNEKSIMDNNSFREGEKHALNKMLDNIPTGKEITNQLNALHLKGDCRRAYAEGIKWMRNIIDKQIGF